jgi:hypothetical protein
MDERQSRTGGLSVEELAGEDAAALPNREAMSLISGSLFDGSLVNDPSVMQQPDLDSGETVPADGAQPLPAETGLEDSPFPLKNPLVG